MLGIVVVIDYVCCIGYMLLIFDDFIVICLFGDVFSNYVIV